MEHIEHLPQEIRSVVRGFCSHPIADALRPHVVEYKVYSTALATQTYPDANTFYLYFFTNKKLVNVMATLKRNADSSRCRRAGVRVGTPPEAVASVRASLSQLFYRATKYTL